MVAASLPVSCGVGLGVGAWVRGLVGVVVGLGGGRGGEVLLAPTTTAPPGAAPPPPPPHARGATPRVWVLTPRVWVLGKGGGGRGGEGGKGMCCCVLDSCRLGCGECCSWRVHPPARPRPPAVPHYQPDSRGRGGAGGLQVHDQAIRTATAIITSWGPGATFSNASHKSHATTHHRAPLIPTPRHPHRDRSRAHFSSGRTGRVCCLSPPLLGPF